MIVIVAMKKMSDLYIIHNSIYVYMTYQFSGIALYFPGAGMPEEDRAAEYYQGAKSVRGAANFGPKTS